MVSFFHRRISIFKRKGAAAPHNLCYRSFIVCLTTHISNLLNSYYFHRESNFFPSCIHCIICNGSRTNIVSIFIHPTSEPISFSRYSWNKICFFRESNFFPSCIHCIICNGSRTNIVSIFIHPTSEPISFSRYSWNKICFFTISI